MSRWTVCGPLEVSQVVHHPFRGGELQLALQGDPTSPCSPRSVNAIGQAAIARVMEEVQVVAT